MIDLHCDTVSKLASVFHRGNLMHNPYSVDVERLEKAGALMQCFSTFFDVGKYGTAKRDEKAYVTANHMIDVFEKNLKECHDKVVFVKKYEDIQQCMDTGRIGALLTLEDGTPVGNSLEKLQHFYNRGIRLITLTWNYENELAFPNKMTVDENGKVHAEPDTENGLKPAGFAMVEAMENLGVIIDVSHLNDAGIFDILRTVKKDTPVIASHSNARAICHHPRNLTDEMLRQIADHGGICGINFAYEFISDEESESQLTTIDGMIRHMTYIRNVAGIDTIGFGSDFDGIGNPVEVKNAAGMQQIAQKMELAGFTLDEIEKVFYKNALRVYKQVLG